MLASKPRWKIAEFDYDRIEVVVLAMLCEDPTLQEAVKLSDFHSENAKKIFKLPPGVEPTKEQRAWGKTMTFAIIYGQLPSTYAARNGCSLEEADRMYKDFFAAYPGIKAYFNRVEKEVRDTGKAITLFGRVRTFELQGDNRDWSVLLEAKNFGIQSVATDITSWMLCEILDEAETNIVVNKGIQYGKHFKIINVVHDSIWITYDPDYEIEILDFIKNIMEDMSRLPIKFDLPLKVSYTTGYSLAETL